MPFTPWVPVAGGGGPVVVPLTDAPTIAVNGSAGNYFRVTLGGNRTMGSPTNPPSDGQPVRFEVIQDATGSRTLAWGGAYVFGAAGTPTLTITPAKRDLLGFVYSANEAAWLFSGITQGM